MLTFCYPGLNKVTLVNQLSLLLIFKTTIGETWNAANVKSTKKLLAIHESAQTVGQTVIHTYLPELHSLKICERMNMW